MENSLENKNHSMTVTVDLLLDQNVSSATTKHIHQGLIPNLVIVVSSSVNKVCLMMAIADQPVDKSVLNAKLRLINQNNNLIANKMQIHLRIKETVLLLQEQIIHLGTNKTVHSLQDKILFRI